MFRLILSGLLLSLLLLASCSARHFYESIQGNQKLGCANLPRSQQQECYERADVTYDDYKKETKELRSPDSS